MQGGADYKAQERGYAGAKGEPAATAGRWQAVRATTVGAAGFADCEMKSWKEALGNARSYEVSLSDTKMCPWDDLSTCRGEGALLDWGGSDNCTVNLRNL